MTKSLTDILAAATPAKPVYVALHQGCAVRLATDSEKSAYKQANATRAQKQGGGVFTRACFDKPVKIGDISVDLYTGYGVSHAGAGF